MTVRCWTFDFISIVNYYVDNFSLQADGEELIVNGGFETGDFSGWDVTVSGLYPVVQGDQVPEGSYAAHMGDGGEGMYFDQNIASIAQEISLPAWVEDLLLQLAYLVEFEEDYEDYEFDGDEWAWLEVLIDDQQVLYACSHSDGWQDHEYDLSGYIGKTFTLTVRTVLDVQAMYDWMDENEMYPFPINFCVDDISVTASGVEPEESQEPEEPTEPEPQEPAEPSEPEPQEPAEPSKPEEPQVPPEDELPRTGVTLPLWELPALGLISGGIALLKLRRKLSR